MTYYYLQDSRFFLGNTVVWWAQDGGFTVDVSKAKIFTEKEAFAWHQVRDSDIPWVKEYIDARTKPTVDMLDIERRDGERALAAPATRLPRCHHCDDDIKELVCKDHGCDRWAKIHEKRSDSPLSLEVPKKLSTVLKTSKPIS